jgi:ring-1,2-phenylacetyl-CoA epoxidase subunit PaaC
VERPNGDFAETIVRQFLYSAFADPYWRAMMVSTDPTLAAIAARSEKESAYHLRHASEWLIRLGDGTPESSFRASSAVEAFWPYTGELFDVDGAERGLIDAGIIIDPEMLRGKWDATVTKIFDEATLARPQKSGMQRGGRIGRHSEHLGHLLAEMQHLQRTYPGAKW